jgi:hypothetical protein
MERDVNQRAVKKVGLRVQLHKEVKFLPIFSPG